MSNKVSRTVTDQELNAIMWQESKGDPLAAPATSSALGLGQFLKGTWRDTVSKYRPDVFKAYANGALLNLRKDPSFNIEMLARFTEANRRVVGASSTLGDLYLAHFLGVGTAQKFYRASPDQPAHLLAGAKAAAANKTVFFANKGKGAPKSVGEVRAWAQTVMDAAGRKGGDYVTKFWKGPFVIPASHMGLLNDDAANDDPVVKVDHTADRPGLKPNGDYRLYDNQVQLKHMNYNAGGVDGVWGGGTAGAIAAFFNDYAPEAVAPLKWTDYDARYTAIDSTIDKAESERFIRPVTKERDEADAQTVEKIAPEIVQSKQTLWGGVTAFFGGIGSAAYSVFNWLMDYKDQAENTGLMGYIDRVPNFVWILLGTGVIGFIVYKALKTKHGIEKPVSTGERM